MPDRYLFTKCVEGRIVYKTSPLADESPLDASPRRRFKTQRLVVMDKHTEKRMPAYPLGMH